MSNLNPPTVKTEAELKINSRTNSYGVLVGRQEATQETPTLPSECNLESENSSANHKPLKTDTHVCLSNVIALCECISKKNLGKLTSKGL